MNKYKIVKNDTIVCRTETLKEAYAKCDVGCNIMCGDYTVATFDNVDGFTWNCLPYDFDIDTFVEFEQIKNFGTYLEANGLQLDVRDDGRLSDLDSDREFWYVSVNGSDDDENDFIYIGIAVAPNI